MPSWNFGQRSTPSLLSVIQAKNLYFIQKRIALRPKVDSILVLLVGFHFLVRRGDWSEHSPLLSLVPILPFQFTQRRLGTSQFPRTPTSYFLISRPFCATSCHTFHFGIVCVFKVLEMNFPVLVLGLFLACSKILAVFQSQLYYQKRFLGSITDNYK